MEPLIIYEGQSTPKIVLDKANEKFEIAGNSLPEDVLGFYSPVFNWFEEYIKQPNRQTELHIKLMYFNSSSSKAILDILNMLEEVAVKGFGVEIFWYYLEIDEDMLETGKEFEGMLKLPFQFISYMQD
jgi:hypothetical protein